MALKKQSLTSPKESKHTRVMSNCGKKLTENAGHQRTEWKGQEQEKGAKSAAQSQRGSVSRKERGLVKSLERVATAKAVAHTPLLQKTQTVANAKITKEQAEDTPKAEQKCNGNLTERRQSVTTKLIPKKSTLAFNIGKSIILQMIRVPAVKEKLNYKFKPCLTERRKTSPAKPNDRSKESKHNRSTGSLGRIKPVVVSYHTSPRQKTHKCTPSKETSKKLMTPKVNSKPSLPLSEANLKKLDQMRDGEDVARYIKAHVNKHRAVPSTSIEFYRIGRILGKGAFGKVNLGMHKLTGKLVAVKSIKKSLLANKDSNKKFRQEFSVLKNLRHPNVIRLYESFETEKHILIVMELCSGGDLLNYIRKCKRLKENVAKFVFRSLIVGLNYCHSKGVVHRDIKLDNVLLNSEGELKLCDFGVCKTIVRGERMTERCGTPAYIAPEILRGKGYEGFGADIWSAGIALYAMLYGTVPFKGPTLQELKEAILAGKYTLKEDISKEARDLLAKMLCSSPRKRMTAANILAHPWMQGVDESVSLFSEAEKANFAKEFLHSTESSCDSLFTEQRIDSTLTEANMNNTSKSVIFAPFNSVENEEGEMGNECVEKKLVIRFAAKVRDIDRQYEKNNNGDIDNGVYNKFVRCSTEEENAEGNECKEEDKPKENRDNGLKTQVNFSPPKSAVVERVRNEIDNGSLTQMEQFGFRRDYVVKCLKKNELNHATATYYLLTNHYL